MRGLTLVFVLSLIPALAALGHDAYLFYEHYGIDSVQRDIEQQIEDKGALSFFAALGFILTRYAPDTYKLINESVDDQSWAVINSLLAQKAFFLGLVFSAVVMVLAVILRALGVGREEGGGKWKGKGSGDLSLRDKSGRYKYNRK